MNNFGINLKKLIEINNFSQNEVAKKMCTTQQTISRYVNGITEPDITNLIKLSNLFNVTVDYLLGITDENNYIINDSLSETENCLISLFRSLKSDEQAELYNYANYLKNKKSLANNDFIDIADFDELAKADIMGYVKGLKNTLIKKAK